MIESGDMEKAERRPIPDGRVRFSRLLTDGQLEALRTFKTEGLIMLNINVVDFDPPETWIEYWFDKEIIPEDDLRISIEETVYQALEQ